MSASPFTVNELNTRLSSLSFNWAKLTASPGAVPLATFTTLLLFMFNSPCIEFSPDRSTHNGRKESASNASPTPSIEFDAMIVFYPYY